MSIETIADAEALEDLRIGVETNKHCDPTSAAKLAALDRAIARLRGEEDLLEALQHITKYDADGLGAIGESLARAALAKAVGARA